MKTLIILVGIPCAGKTTYVNKTNYLSSSRDFIRENLWVKYTYNAKNEELVTKLYNECLDKYIMSSNPNSQIIILDNTHCKEKYIDEIISKYENITNISIKFFDISLYKAYYRNLMRYFKTGKFVPFSIITNMYKNYKLINKQKYAKYMGYQ